MENRYFANGKLLLTSEYLVQKGAKALALPLKKQQSLHVESSEGPNQIRWYAADTKDFFFKATIDKSSLKIESTNDTETANTLVKIFRAVKTLKPDFFKNDELTNCQAKIGWPIICGLGASSSLISLIAQWTNTDPFELNNQIFKGSGYDIACAWAEKPITYYLEENHPHYLEVDFKPHFEEHILFIHLNRKQTQHPELDRFRKIKDEHLLNEAQTATQLTESIIKCQEITEFIDLIHEHEALISKVIHQTPIKQELFPDFEGEVKSLGFWGGDFIMACSELDVSYIRKYFYEKGFDKTFSLSELIR